MSFNARDELLKQAKRANREHLELTVLQGIRAIGLPEPEREFVFHPTRKWRFDFAWPDHEPKLALEIDGGQWMGRSGHTSGAGVQRDAEKANAAQLLGWTVLRATTSMVESGAVYDLIEEAFGASR